MRQDEWILINQGNQLFSMRKGLEALDRAGMKKGKERVSNAELERMINKFLEDTVIVNKLKLDNASLRRKIDALIQNNDKFVELVRNLEERGKKVVVRKEQELIYSYQDGSMVQKEEIGKQRIRLRKKKLTLDEINNQLSQILRKLESGG